MPTNAAEMASMSLAEMAAGIANRNFSSLEATEATLERLSKTGAAFNAVAACNADIALDAARRADAKLAASDTTGVLHGVPLAHKDAFYRVGRISACGSRILADQVADRTAAVLERLDAAGALDVAQLNMTEFATGAPVFGHNRITGTPRNPWNPDHGVGGSSSGPAAAVAAGLVSAALASDTGGSIRIPASCCGLVGIKPTYGRVSRYGAMPLAYSFDHPGIVTRSVEDCALMLEVIAGHDPRDSTTTTLPVPRYRDTIENGIAGMRIGVPQNYFYDYVEDEIGAVLEAAVAVFAAAGAEIVPVRMPESLATAVDAHRIIFQSEAASFHRWWIEQRPEDYGPWTRQRIEPGLEIAATRYVDAQQSRETITSEFSAAAFSSADVLFTPVVPIPVPTLEASDPDNLVDYLELSSRVSHCTRPINLLGVPALSIPGGFDKAGLPVGFQLVGRHFDEALLFQAGAAYERATHWPTIAPARN